MQAQVQLAEAEVTAVAVEAAVVLVLRLLQVHRKRRVKVRVAADVAAALRLQQFLRRPVLQHRRLRQADVEAQQRMKIRIAQLPQEAEDAEAAVAQHHARGVPKGSWNIPRLTTSCRRAPRRTVWAACRSSVHHGRNSRPTT